MISRPWLIGGALALYLVILVGAGVLTASRTKSFKEYVTGGGAIPAWMLALSFMANFISSNSFVGHAAQSYKTGLIWLVVGGVVVACCALSWTVFAPRFAAFARETDASTLPDFFAKRFNSTRVAAVVHWIVVLTTMLYVLAILRGTALVVASGLDISYEAALFLLYGVTLAYCTLGGLWADVATDVVQSVILVVGAVALALAVATAPTPVGIAEAPPIKAPPIGFVLAIGLAGGAKLLADPKQVMVFYAFKDEASVRRFRIFGPLLLALIYGSLFPVGYLARRLVSSAPDLDQLIPTLLFERQILGPWFGALLLIALFAASMSSLDSSLLVMASCIEKHVVAPIVSAGEPSARRTRWALFGVTTAALLLSLRPLGGIIALTSFAGALLGGALLPAIVAGLFRVEVSARAVTLSIAAGFAGAVLGRVGPEVFGIKSPWFQDVFIGILASSAALAPSAWAARRAAREGRRGRGLT
jgi:Na+/pantothenate symporter